MRCKPGLVSPELGAIVFGAVFGVQFAVNSAGSFFSSQFYAFKFLFLDFLCFCIREPLWWRWLNPTDPTRSTINERTTYYHRHHQHQNAFLYSSVIR